MLVEQKEEVASQLSSPDVDIYIFFKQPNVRFLLLSSQLNEIISHSFQYSIFISIN